MCSKPPKFPNPLNVLAIRLPKPEHPRCIAGWLQLRKGIEPRRDSPHRRLCYRSLDIQTPESQMRKCMVYIIYLHLGSLGGRLPGIYTIDYYSIHWASGYSRDIWTPKHLLRLGFLGVPNTDPHQVWLEDFRYLVAGNFQSTIIRRKWIIFQRFQPSIFRGYVSFHRRVWKNKFSNKFFLLLEKVLM